MILDVQDLSFRYSKNAKPIFHNVNLQMEKGEILTILGANGAGKSTLLNVWQIFWNLIPERFW